MNPISAVQSSLVAPKNSIETHLDTLKILNSNFIQPNQKELQELSLFTKDLIEKPETEAYKKLMSLEKKSANNEDDLIINDFIRFVKLMKERLPEIKIIEEKFSKKERLTYKECLLMDIVRAKSHFTIEITKAGLTDNAYFNIASKLTLLANENAFKGYQDGDVLFYDLPGRMNYVGASIPLCQKITMKVLGTSYVHVGVFFRTRDGKPCIAHVNQEGFDVRVLPFGQMSFIRGRRVNPAKFTATQMTEEDRLKAQKRIGEIFAKIVTSKSYKINVTQSRVNGSILSHRTSEANTKLGMVKMRDNTEMLCAEFAGVGLMDAFDTYNQEVSKEKALSCPFSEHENMARLHSDRLLNFFGPHKGEALVESGWEDVPPSDFANVLPILPEFPKHTSNNPPK